MTSSGIFDNEASSVDLKVYDELRVLGWSRESKTLLYQPKYDLSPEEQADFPGSKHIKPDFVLQDLQGGRLRLSKTSWTILTRRLSSCG